MFGLPLNWLSRPNPALVVHMLAYYNGGADRRLLLGPDILKAIARSLTHAFRQGSGASIQDLRLYRHTWGFELTNVQKKVLLWHGAHDTVVPYSHSEYVHSELPHSKLSLLPQEGHFSLPIVHAKGILTALCEAVMS